MLIHKRYSISRDEKKSLNFSFFVCVKTVGNGCCVSNALKTEMFCRASRGGTCPKLKGFDVAPIVGAFLPRSGWKLSWFTGGAQQHQSSEEPAGKGRGSVAWAATAVRGWEAVDLGRRVGAKHTIAVRLQPLNQTSKQNVRFANPHAPGADPSPLPLSLGGVRVAGPEAQLQRFPLRAFGVSPQRAGRCRELPR